MKDRLAQISFFKNEDVITELNLLIEYINDIYRNLDLFPDGIFSSLFANRG